MQKLYVKSTNVIKTCFHCALVPKKKESRERKCLIILLTLSCFSSCLSNVQTDLHHMLLILTNPIRCMINIKACYLFDILCITKQVGIRGFLQYFIVFFFFLNVKIRFFPLVFWKFGCTIYCIFPFTETYYQCELRLENKKKQNIFGNQKFTSQNNTLSRRHLPVQSQQGNTRIIYEITTPMTAGFKLQYIYKRRLLFPLCYISIVSLLSIQIA